MAEKKELSTEEKIALAKDLYSHGSRNYLVKNYSESADELSKACELYAEIYGNYADELAMPYLLYGKSLIALAQQGENKVLTVPDEETDEEDDDDDNDEEDGDGEEEEDKDKEMAKNENEENVKGATEDNKDTKSPEIKSDDKMETDEAKPEKVEELDKAEETKKEKPNEEKPETEEKKSDKKENNADKEKSEEVKSENVEEVKSEKSEEAKLEESEKVKSENEKLNEVQLEKEKCKDEKPEENGKTVEPVKNGAEKPDEPSSSSDDTKQTIADEPDRASKSTVDEPTKTNDLPAAADDKKDNKDDDDDGDEEDDDSTPTENLQIAWEILEMAVQIFARQGVPALANLADAYFELAEVSMENSNFELAITDFKKCLKIRMNLPTNDLRIIAEIHYKVGLNYLMLCSYAEAVKSLKEANRALDCEIDTLRDSDNTPDEIERQIKEIEELKKEILNKVQEIEEVKEQSMEEVKAEISKIIGNAESFPSGSSTSNGESKSSEMEADKPKPTDISYLIKRKKPDSQFESESSPKRPAT